MHGNRQVSTKNLARQIGAKSVEPCKPEVAQRHSGYLVGGTSPFGTRKAMPVYVEASILALPRICINGGRRGYLVGIEPQCADRGCWARSRCAARRQNHRRLVPADRLRRPQSSTDELLPSLAAALAAYLVGSLSFAVIVSRAMGLADPRTYGSQQPRRDQRAALGQQGRGGAHVAARRAEGLRAGVAGACCSASAYGLGEGTVALVGLAAFLGHLWPVFFRFQGGKGVATAIGVLFGINPWLGLATLRHLGHHRRVLPLLVAGVDRRRGVRAVLSAADLGSRAGARRRSS